MERMKKEDKEKILKVIEKAGDPENYETSWDDKGVPKSKEKSKIKSGKKSKSLGARFELKVRQDLENKERVVDKWSNNVDLAESKVVPAKRKFNPYSKVMTIGTGFPDFISFKKISEGVYSVIGVECKVNGLLSREEKEKCAWYLQHEIFSEIWIARQEKKGGKTEIKYEDFKEKYGEKFLLR